jgi:hypothetical protein
MHSLARVNDLARMAGLVRAATGPLPRRLPADNRRPSWPLRRAAGEAVFLRFFMSVTNQERSCGQRRSIGTGGLALEATPRKSDAVPRCRKELTFMRS